MYRTRTAAFLFLQLGDAQIAASEVDDSNSTEDQLRAGRTLYICLQENAADSHLSADRIFEIYVCGYVWLQLCKAVMSYCQSGLAGHC